MKRTGRYRRGKQKKILIIGSLSLLLFLCAGYAAFSTNLKITAKGNVKEKTRVIQAWSATDQTDFHSDFYKQNIVSVTFLDNNNVPSNVTESWNVSEDKENGGVMAWVIPSNNDSSKYDLYIGAKAGVIANEDSSNLFYNFGQVININFDENFDTSDTVNMSRMFNYCTSLLTLDVSSFDTSNVIDMSWMFHNCGALTLLNVSGFNTSNVTDMSYMFARCESISTLDVSSFNTSKVTNMRDIFSYNTNLIQIIGLENFNTSNVTNMVGMFNYDGNLTKINLCSFNTNKVTSMELMFANTSSLTAVYVGSNWSTTNAVVNNMFYQSGVSSVTTGQC